MNNKRVMPILLLIGLMLVNIQTTFAQDAEADAQTPEAICASATPQEPETRSFEAPEDVLEFGVDYYAIVCTSVGPIYIDLYETFTPLTVNNFVFLAENGYYDNTTFHRVLEDFMAQGGDPTATGTGGPGYSFADEFVSFLTFDQPGLLAMANSGPNTNGSQFFLTTGVTDWLNYQHTIFGDVVVGQDVVESIPLRDPAAAEAPGASLNTVVIITDASKVDASIPEADAAPVGEADFELALADFPALPEFLVIDEEASGVVDIDAVAERAGDAAEAINTLLSENNHQFSVASEITNSTCDLETAGFAETGVMVHVFESAVDAAVVANSEALQTLVTLGQEGFEQLEDTEGAGPVFAKAESACEQDMQHGYMARLHGRFLIVTDVLVLGDRIITIPLGPGRERTRRVEAEATVDRWLNQVVNNRIYDVAFGNLFKRELENR